MNVKPIMEALNLSVGHKSLGFNKLNMSNSSPASYIHMVQHMIETCLIYKMSKEECIETVFKNANINPIITSTVWEELVKKNKEFFDDYEQNNYKHKKNEPMSKEDPMSEVDQPMSEEDTMSEVDQPMLEVDQPMSEVDQPMSEVDQPMLEGETNQMIENIISGSPED